MKKFTGFLLAVIMLQTVLAAQGAGKRTREFKQYQCKLTLPEGFQWNDINKPKAATAMCQSPNAILILMVRNLPKPVKVDRKFIEDFDKGYNKKGKLAKISGKKCMFLGIPAYQLKSRFTQNNFVGDCLTFPANGRIYVLHSINLNPAGGKLDTDKLFSAFEFTQKPEVLP